MLTGSDLYKQTVESLTISLVHLEKKTAKVYERPQPFKNTQKEQKKIPVRQ